MSTARILLRHNGLIYRLFRFETSADGSLLAFLDRNARPQTSGMTLDGDGAFVPEEGSVDRPKSSTKFTIHTTGEVHRELGGKRKGTMFIEPLTHLTALHPIGVVSIPRLSRLDVFDSASHQNATEAILDFPAEVSEGIHFALEIGPKPQSPASYGVALNYEIYSVVARVVPAFPVTIPPELGEHFVSGMPRTGSFDVRQIDVAAAELAFYRAAHSGAHPIFRDGSGAYVMFAAVPMRIAPKLEVDFDRPDLYIEQIAFGLPLQPTHKARFWVCDKAGRNKKDDLRRHIISAMLDAEL